VLTGVTFPVWEGRCGFAIEELARRDGDFAIAGAALAVEIGDDHIVRRCAIGLFGLGPTPERAAAAEALVIGADATDVLADDVGHAAVSTLASIPSDLHGSADYRAHIAVVMVARAWRRAVKEALDG
jgi:carbon-monoxide dehydrogenase medium subunit